MAEANELATYLDVDRQYREKLAAYERMESEYTSGKPDREKYAELSTTRSELLSLYAQLHALRAQAVRTRHEAAQTLARASTAT